MTKFSDLYLDPKVLQAITEAGYDTPTPIQEQAIPQALMAKDVLGIAQTGTGKTAAFTLPMISILAQGRAKARMPRSLVLCPTRELAAQVSENFEIYGKYHKLSMALLIGGVSFKDQDKLIDRGVDVLIATPGRLLDHVERGKLMLTGIEIMVVDEADRMLDMGFIPDIERIFKMTPFTRQTLFFSATMPPEITRLTQEFLHNPTRVEVAKQSTTGENITQRVVSWKAATKDTSDREKRDVLRALIDADLKAETLTNAIVFCNRKSNVDIVAKSLNKHGYNAAAIHGDLDQKVRMRTLDGFRAGDIKILCASDVAARGLDIPSVSHVFNFDVPIHSEDYVHRIGRTGRAGRSGFSFTLCLPHDEKYIEKIEELIASKVERMDPPEGAIREMRGRPRRQNGEKAEGNAPTGRSSSRRRNNNDKDRNQKQDAPATEAQAAASAPSAEPKAEAQAPTAKAETPKPREERAPRQQKQDRNAEPRSAAKDNNQQQERQPRGRGRGGNNRSRYDNGPVVKGLGDHVPAFMNIPLPDLKATSRKTTADDGDDDTGDEAA
ncbi:MAG: DEAD/DEAH box helicase [Pikeienuella sp.]